MVSTSCGDYGEAQSLSEIQTVRCLLFFVLLIVVYCFCFVFLFVLLDCFCLVCFCWFVFFAGFLFFLNYVLVFNKRKHSAS